MPGKAASALAELRALRAAGKTRGSTYEVKDAQDVYYEVDQENYKKLVRNRLDDDDFVADDDGRGYADNGGEDWQDERHAYTDEESDGDLPARGEAKKRKRQEDEEKQRRENKNISNYFNATTRVAPPKQKAVATAEDDAFLDNLLQGISGNAQTRPRAVVVKKEKLEPPRKKRMLSPPLSDASKQKSKVDKLSRSDQSAAGTADNLREDEDDEAPRVGNDDIPSDPPVPSSPVINAIERRTQPAAEMQEDGEDDEMEVAEAVGFAGAATMSVNMSGIRPVKKEIKQQPTPESSSPTRPPPQVVDHSEWTDITKNLNVLSSSAGDVSAPVGKLRPQDATEDDGSLRFFWIDYTELNGSLLLFGKVRDKSTNSFVSAFVKVDGVLRNLYFLPREHRHKHGNTTSEEVDMGMVYEEVDNIMTKERVKMHKIKPCERKYAFELPDVPKEAEYLKLLYPYDKPALPVDLSGETFSRVFGTNTSLFEQFVLWKNIMGPCWLKIEGAGMDFNAVTNASWCKLELAVPDAKLISTLSESENMEAPPLTLMSIALRTIMNTKDNKQEILVASARIYENVSLTDTTPPEKLPCKTLTIMRPAGEGFPTGFKMDAEKTKSNIKLERSEQGLLSLLMAHIQRIDPDVFIGHRLEDLDYSILLNRMRERKTPGWHRIGRLRRSEWPKTMGKGGASFFVERQLVAGRLLCDLANDMGKSTMTKCQSWSLAEMCELVLGKASLRREIDNETALRTWAATREGLMHYVQHCETDTFFIAAIALKVQMLPLTKVLTNLAGNSWARTLTGTRAERNEYILLHEFYRNKYICPDKIYGKAKPKEEEEPAEGGDENPDAKKKEKYKGGLVFEPEKGLYDRIILVMDFNSLYPSIIQEYNICFTTVERSHLGEEDDRVPEVPEDQSLGVLPRLISNLVTRRREVKKLMKDKTATPDQLATWDIKQLALKLTANSMYGCLGYTKSRFYARPLAMLTTFKGREILRSTKELAEVRQLQVIYGDTDSVMINTNMDTIADALKVGNEFKRAVNERYRLLEIDIDNTFRRLLLHAKKKYAAINLIEIDGKFVEKLEVKGLDMRRREYCALSKETSSKLLNLLLSGEDPESVVNQIHDHLRTLAENMRGYKIPMQKYTIFTQLSKEPSAYANSKSMPSVQCALRMVAKGKVVHAKDVIPFIITGENHGSLESAAGNAMPPDTVLKPDSGLKPDVDYYLHKQILPPVERLCAPISLTNITRLAECLGLDTSKYRVSTASGAHAEDARDQTLQPLDSQLPESVRFAACTSLRLHCLAPECTDRAFTFRGIADDSHAVSHAGITCPSCKTPMSNLSVVCQVEHQLRQMQARYYDGWLECDDPSCGQRTRQMSVYGHRCLGPQGLGRGCLGKMRYVFGEKQLWTQLVYWERAFDVDRAKSRASAPVLVGAAEDGEGKEKVKILADVNRERFGTLQRVVKGYLDRSGRQWVDMGSLFGFMR